MKIAILCYFKSRNANLDKSVLDNIKAKVDNYYKKGYSNLLVKLFYKCPWVIDKIVKIKGLA